MKFIEIVDGFSIRVDSIVSIDRIGENLIRIETENRNYELVANFRILMDALDEEEKRKREVEKLTNQYFGG